MSLLFLSTIYSHDSTFLEALKKLFSANFIRVKAMLKYFFKFVSQKIILVKLLPPRTDYGTITIDNTWKKIKVSENPPNKAAKPNKKEGNWSSWETMKVAGMTLHSPNPYLTLVVCDGLISASIDLLSPPLDLFIGSVHSAIHRSSLSSGLHGVPQG